MPHFDPTRDPFVKLQMREKILRQQLLERQSQLESLLRGPTVGDTANIIAELDRIKARLQELP